MTTTANCNYVYTTFARSTDNGGKHVHTVSTYKAVEALIETVGASLVLEHLDGGKLTLIGELETQGKEIVGLARLLSNLTDMLVKHGAIPECRP